MKRQPLPQQRPSRYRRRVIFAQAALIVAFGAVAARIYYVQTKYGPTLLTDAAQVQTAHESLLAQRGALLDRNGQRLAYDVPAYMLDINTSGFSDLQNLAARLAPILKTSPDRLAGLFESGNHHWVRWPDPILEPIREAILAAVGTDHTSDVTFTPTEKRIYPYGEFAANTLGYVTHDGVGATGLEAQYNSVLSGVNGEISYVRDIWGFPLQTSMHTTKPAVPGKDVQLTLDSTIQGFVEAKMDELVNKYHPEHAAIIVTDPNTGEILGMASRPTFDPNRYWAADPKALSDNWAVNDAFEPGSTFKILTLAAGLTTGVITMDQTFMSGHLTVAGHHITDWNHKGWGVITFRQALEESSNVGFATVALKLGWDKLLQYMKLFGYLDKTGVDLPAEASSLVFPESSRGPVQLATSGFGQGIAVTPMQQVMAVGAIANGGKLIRPHLAKAILDPSTGKVLKEIQPTVINPQVVPPDVVRQIQDTLVLDVSAGIDDIGRLPGYDVAGKTGTANTVDPKTGKYYSDRFIVSFIGYAPGWDPKFEVYVTLYWPKTAADNQWGSTVATPAARDILQECLQYAHIPPRGTTSQAKAGTSTATTTKYVQTPDLHGQTADRAKAELAKLGLTADWIGAAGAVSSQWPPAGVEVPAGSRMYLWASTAPGSHLTMPDLTGLSMREAGDVLAALGLRLKPSGDGFAVAQSIPPGSPVSSGSTIEVTFAPPRDPVAASAAQPAAAAGAPPH